MSNTQITTFVINNGGLLATLLVAIVGLFQSIVSKKKQQIYTNLYSLVSDAEKLANATGLDKFKQVFDEAYTKLPAIFKFFISEDDIKRGIEYSLNKLEAYAKLQAQDSSTTTVSTTSTNIEAPSNGEPH